MSAPPRASLQAEAGLAAVERYYRLHARLYDATRWSFLFGRRQLQDRLPFGFEPATVLEVGCGTGFNLARMAARYPGAHITGVDASADMLKVARRRAMRHLGRIRLVHRAYQGSLGGSAGFDLVVFSYALSMFNPGREDALDAALQDLAPAGLVAVVDFDRSPVAPFRRWMGLNHVRMDGHLGPVLRSRLVPSVDRSRPVYGGLWSYLTFVGRPRG